MEELASNILEVIKDYRNDDGVQITIENIIGWANQFEDDAEFILNELNHIIPQVYLSKENAKKLILSHIKQSIKDYGYNSPSAFLIDTEFLDMQRDGKSQKIILELIEEVLNSEYNESYKEYLTFPKLNFIYFDDVLATGGTIGRHLVEWLSKEDAEGVTNADKVTKGNINLSIHLFCLHSWGHAFQKFRIKKAFTDAIDSKIKWYRNFKIENHVKWNNQSLNIAIPTKDQPVNAKTYLANLSAEKYIDYAYRKEQTPKNETFFTSSENRIKYENLLLQKGLSIIEMINGEVSPNVRPLGFVNPNYKTYGLGTHFFTWRNIPNNSPLVFWWGVEGHDWLPLFPVGNRGGF